MTDPTDDLLHSNSVTLSKLKLQIFKFTRRKVQIELRILNIIKDVNIDKVATLNL